MPRFVSMAHAEGALSARHLLRSLENYRNGHSISSRHHPFMVTSASFLISRSLELSQQYTWSCPGSLNGAELVKVLASVTIYTQGQLESFFALGSFVMRE